MHGTSRTIPVGITNAKVRAFASLAISTYCVSYSWYVCCLAIRPPPSDAGSTRAHGYPQCDSSSPSCSQLSTSSGGPTLGARGGGGILLSALNNWVVYKMGDGEQGVPGSYSKQLWTLHGRHTPGKTSVNTKLNEHDGAQNLVSAMHFEY